MPSDDAHSSKDPELARAIRRREAIAERERAAQSRIAELEAQLEERDSNLEKANGETNKVIERLQKKLEDREERLRGYAEKEERQAKLSRRDKFVEAISAKSGVTNKVRIRALLREYGELEGVDTSPEEINKALVVETIEGLKQLDGDTFSPSPGKATPVAGSGVKAAPEDRRSQIKRMAEERAAQRYGRK